MAQNERLRFVVHVDDYDEPGEVLDSLALEPFVAGRHPVARTKRLNTVRPNASFIPRQTKAHRTAETPWRKIILSEGPGWTLKATRWRDETATLVVTATKKKIANAVLAEVSKDAAAPAPDKPETRAPVGFWYLGGRGSSHSVRSIEVCPWACIRKNYTATAAKELEELMALSPSKLTGRLLLLHGPPGTGKTGIIRAIAHEWRDWCSTECVLDPEALLRKPGYLSSVMLGDADDDDGDETSHGWRLLVLEDCDEVVCSSAKSGDGQALSRLLNITDGLLGQGRKILICITTNEDFTRFHPAVIRPGRCLKQIEVGPLTREESAAWLGVGPADWPAGATLADLYAARDGYRPAARKPTTGQYI